jgi:hypothetical protein
VSWIGNETVLRFALGMSSSNCGFASRLGSLLRVGPSWSGRQRAPGEAQSGQALTEFALVLPLFLLVILGIFKFGVAYNNYLTLTDAVRSGARQLALDRGAGGGLPSAPCTDAIGRVQSAAEGLDQSSLTVTVFADATTSPSDSFVSDGPSSGSGTCDTMISGDAATVSASYPCDATIFGIDFAPGCHLTASATERTE